MNPNEKNKKWGNASCNDLLQDSAIKLKPIFEDKKYNPGDEVTIRFDIEEPQEGVELKSMSFSVDYQTINIKEPPWEYTYEFEGYTNPRSRKNDEITTVSFNNLHIWGYNHFEVKGKSMPILMPPVISQSGIQLPYDHKAGVETLFTSYIGIDKRDGQDTFTLTLFDGDTIVGKETVTLGGSQPSEKYIQFKGDI